MSCQELDCNAAFHTYIAEKWCDPCALRIAPSFLTDPPYYQNYNTIDLWPRYDYGCGDLICGTNNAENDFDFETTGPARCYCDDVGVFICPTPDPWPGAPVGLCCTPPTFMGITINPNPYQPTAPCERYTTADCCSHIGGTWLGYASEGARVGDCVGNCPGAACCGCNWCCDERPGVECTGLKVYPWENLPIPKTTPCVGNTCPETPPKPICRREEFVIGKRPAAHEPPLTGGSRGGRHELHSLAPVRAIDYAPGIEECRTYYGHVGKGLGAPKHLGWLCGQWHRTNTSTKRANQCHLSKRADGRHSFQCAYRVPCPEKPTVCL